MSGGRDTRGEERGPEEEGPEKRAAGEQVAEESAAEAEEREPDERVSGADGPGPSDGDGLRVLRGLVSPTGQQSKQSHAGNGTVNDGLDDQGPDQGTERLDSAESAGSERLTDSDRSGRSGRSAESTEPAESDRSVEPAEPAELDVRSLLHRSVGGMEPREGSLEYLQRAVPARRARKRQILVGAAAAALFLGTAVPALVHVSNVTGSDANPFAIGHASETEGSTGEGKKTGGGETTAGGTSDQVEGTDKNGKKDKEQGAGPGSSTGEPEKAGPSSSAAAGVAACTAAQLGPAVASSVAPDSTGAVYGTFRVGNVSTASCSVGGPGGVSVTALGAADPAEVGSARHVAGDAAAGLPDPSLESAPLVLEPGETYDVKFAWVPSETCPADGGTGGETGGGTEEPSPDPSPSQQDPTASSGTSTGGDTGTAAQLLRTDGSAEGSVTVTYTAVTGGTATVTVANACAGTVYWTGLLPTLTS
ncbi:hypothetical protein JL475_28080 [Streptomyces sp. M2CJ-2]|uniref:hypothetical protein n=1 Tax=Streptomyces sp. M2CJ-2 TaxID=2803948 RepID=UPI001929134C|nr:hypothetical protein [Streptomyces sp. M2CJ-2]MBL3669773.1 hypothetical protein [Streptomyces sp. M2CJ-2]